MQSNDVSLSRCHSLFAEHSKSKKVLPDRLEVVKDVAQYDRYGRFFNKSGYQPHDRAIAVLRYVL